MEKREKIKKIDKNLRQSKIIIKNSYKQKLLFKKKKNSDETKFRFGCDRCFESINSWKSFVMEVTRIFSMSISSFFPLLKTLVSVFLRRIKNKTPFQCSAKSK